MSQMKLDASLKSIIDKIKDPYLLAIIAGWVLIGILGGTSPQTMYAAITTIVAIIGITTGTIIILLLHPKLHKKYKKRRIFKKRRWIGL